MYHLINSVHFHKMKKPNRALTANDNSPNQDLEEVTCGAVSFTNNGFSKLNKSSVNSNGEYITEIPTESGNKLSLENRSLKISITLWATSLAMGLSSILGDMSTEIKTFSALAILWSGLWTSYVAADHNRWRLSEISIVSALSGLMSVFMIASNYLGLNLTLIKGVILMSILSVIMSHVLKSRIAILISICASLLWAVMVFMGLAPMNNMVILFPLLTGLQIYAGSRIESGLVIGLSIITAYYALVGFLTTLWTENLIPATFAVSLLFIIGVAHHRVGKSAEDSKVPGSNLHIYSGWVIAMVSAVIFQFFWLNTSSAVASTALINSSGFNLWKTAVSASILVIFISGIIRFKYTQITLVGIFLLTIGSALIPLMMWFPDWPQTLAAKIPGLNTIPTFGIIIGAGIIASSLGFSLNGLRRKSYIMLFLGLSIFGVESYILLVPSLMNVDNIIIFFTTFLVALAIGGAIAGKNSLVQLAPAPRLKHV